MVGLALVVAQAASVSTVSTDTFATLRAIVTPSLICERGFDDQRRKLLDEERTINRMPIKGQEEDRLWRAAYSAFQERDQQFSKVRAVKCTPDLYADRLKARLNILQPKLSPSEIHAFSVGFYNDLRRSSEIAADFSAGYDTRQYSPPSAPPAPK